MKTFLKQFDRWSKSLSWPMMFTACLPYWYAAFILPLDPLVGSCMYVAALLLLILAVKDHARKTITLILLAALLALPVRAQDDSDAHPQTVDCQASYIMGGTVIVVGGLVIYYMYKVCKKLLTPPPGPPPDPDDPPATNAPPSNPTNSVPCTNCNAAAFTAPGMDIGSYGWMDRTDPQHPALFTDFCRLTMQSSTDLKTWANYCTVGIWMSTNSLASVVYDVSGVPVATNRVAGNPFTNPLVDAIPFPLIDPASPRRYYRWAR